MGSDNIKAIIEALPEIGSWPELAAIFDSADSVSRPDWRLPLVACEAMGVGQEQALPAAAAIACRHISLSLVDDIIDNDPRGHHQEHGAGPTAKYALAINAASFLPIALRKMSALPSEYPAK